MPSRARERPARVVDPVGGGFEARSAPTFTVRASLDVGRCGVDATSTSTLRRQSLNVNVA